MQEILDLIREEIERQPKELVKLLKEKGEPAKRGSIFVGAGDSYIVSLIAFYASNGRCLAMDPYSLYSSREFSKGRDVYFVSISGRTKSNIELARELSGIANSRIAITADENSPLANQVDLIIKLPYSPKKLPGTLSFTLATLLTLKLVKANLLCDFDKAYKNAKSRHEEILFADNGTTYFLGNSIFHTLSLYATAKIYEFFGAKSQVQMLEQFSHMDIFSLTEFDTINILSSFDPLGKSKRLHELLITNGYRSKIVVIEGSDLIEQLFYGIFLIQLNILRKAYLLNLIEPYFTVSGKKLEISNAMIY